MTQNARAGRANARQMEESMVYYFTFGSDPEYPYGRDEFVEVSAPNGELAGDLFRAFHPNRPGSEFINCAMIYNYDQWQKVYEEYYKGKQPVERISVCRNLRDE